MSVDPEVVKTAVDSMLRVHAETGHDLTAWPEVLPLVVAVYPDIQLEGTGPNGEHTQNSGTGETGRYWINGVQNTNAYIDSESEWAKWAKKRMLARKRYLGDPKARILSETEVWLVDPATGLPVVLTMFDTSAFPKGIFAPVNGRYGIERDDEMAIFAGDFEAAEALARYLTELQGLDQPYEIWYFHDEAEEQ